ncbi:MAG: D-aminoacylase [Gemmatimonadota bacterium]|nr:D-aminoacylase [Gemmatimonadota bacterium]MDH3367488.1 D-aminoacylase [Gemmatimonadota bacterium]MDH3477456.1 D-aminoacylase [Gemmatimonadota bacterium]MDH3569413.1 D-aminoacylase [Gemmatimonadota bacterium]MDH5549253.1 D-aminoacylase [Gemmatimonadota bacterium]
MRRRDFVRASAAFATGIATRPRRARGAADHLADVLFRGGLVFDGTGASPIEADVLVVGDHIADVARRIRRTTSVEVSVEGLAVAPGFVDIHSHTDLDLFVSPLAESKIRQGVTTEVTGQDGSSIGPWSPETATMVRERYRERHGIDLTFSDLAGFFAQLERRGTAVNLASMVGHGTIRAFVIGDENRPATPDELASMRRLAEEALAFGACGVSTGLEYVPGGFANLEELVSVAAALQGTGLPYASHMRNEDDHLAAAVEEALNVGRLAGVPVQIAHLKAQGQRNWWKATPILDTLMAARRDGIDVTYDRYPYVAYSTGLTSLFPVWARDGGIDGLLGRLASPDLAVALERAVRSKIAQLGSWDAVQITSTADESVGWAVGRRLGALATERNEEPYDLLLRIIRDDRGRTGMVGFGMSEENTQAFLAHPLGMICSDGSALATSGPLASGTPHPRSFGTFPRVLGHYCRERNAMPLETAIHKMTGMPARRLRLDGRGAVAPGAFADLVVFDPDTVADTATFSKPHQYPVGIVHVLVNGAFALEGGERTAALPGRVLRPARA